MLALQLLDIAIILLIAALGLRARPADVLLLIRAPRLGARALSALFVFAPACTLLLTLSMPMEPAIRASLLALSVAPLAPILAMPASMTRDDDNLVVGLHAAAIATSLVSVPAMLLLCERLFGFATHYPITDMLIVMLRQIGLPLTIGMGLAPILGARRGHIAVWMERLGNILLITGMALLLAMVLPELWSMAINGRLLSVVAFTAIVLLGGRLFGGPDRDTREAVIMATAQRHPGIAFIIASTVLPDEEATVIAVIVMYVLAGTIATIPYTLKPKDRSRREAQGLDAGHGAVASPQATSPRAVDTAGVQQPARAERPETRPEP